MFSQFSQNSRKQPASLFGQAVLDIAKSKRQRNDEHMIFTWKTSSPSEVKNHDLPLVEFLHNPLNGLETLQSNSHVTSLTLRPSHTTSKFTIRTHTQLANEREIKTKTPY